MQLLWDASALAKRYVQEVGTDTVHALFGAPQLGMVATMLSYAEVAASYRRKLNQGFIDLSQFNNARVALEAEVLISGSFNLISVETADFLGGVDLIDAHSLNSSDAALLHVYRRYGRQTAEPCILVAADARLLRAAAAEGLRTLNPETVPAADVPVILTQP